ncbi:hypothetical protein VHEMI07046 [[Torrubiella] hemipterigena]|uniref:25S rRNA (Uridine(2843)-N(3))-methyltransferase n=1 Tax=[Torrubiella] hemipterigena TaxID=1531966 RepID=A0A0A1T2C3_9HYPO|nr:hypothetical protein VHEMI07046 [[Torrubiella] hemipterigena]
MTKFKRSAQSQPKHGKPSVSGASKAPIAPPINRPGWTGPGYIRKAAKQTPAAVKEKVSIEQIQYLAVEHQQLILDTIRTTFPAVEDFNALIPVLTAVREALEQKDYTKTFGTEEFLEAYTIRWSPSHALTIANVLAWVCSEMGEAVWVQQFLQNGGQKSSKIVCIGKGGSDLLACVALLKHCHESKIEKLPELESSPSDATPQDDISVPSSHPSAVDKDSAMIDLNLVYKHDWSEIVTRLHHTLTHPPPLSKHATAKARASNISVIPSHAINLAANHLDILDSASADLCTMIGPDPALITLFFTLQEFYSISISKTTGFLSRLTSAAPKGSLLLIVNSPGADVSLPDRNNKGQEKKYPLEWLFYQALTPPKSKSSSETSSEDAEQPAWEKLIENGHEKEYKLPAKLEFPGSLENTRFQVHLLERL